MKRSVVIILLALALLFVMAGIAATLFFAFSPQGSVFRPGLLYATAEESKSLDTDGPVTLKIVDDAGKVTVTGGESQKVTVQVVKTGHGLTQSEAESRLKNIKYQIKQDGNAITLTYDLPNLNNVNQVDTVDFIVSVPSQVTVDVQAQFGEVSVSGTSGDVNITGSFGDVRVENVEGALTAQTSSGEVNASSINAGDADIELTSGFGKVSLEKASGKGIRLDSSSGAISMSEVRAAGDIEMSTDFGDIEASSSSGNKLDVKTNSGKVTLKTLTLEGPLTANSEFGEISVEQVKAAAYDLETNSGSITAEGVFGKVKAHSGFGSVTVKKAESVTLDLSTQSGSVEFEGSLGTGPHTVHSNFGEIILTLPTDSALDVDLKTDFGSISSDIPITMILSGTLEKGHQTGTINAGGEQLKVETQSGNITIKASK